MSNSSSTQYPPHSPEHRKLIDDHRFFELAVVRHQEALVGIELEAARRLFDELRCAKIEHMQCEEAELLPLYATQASWERGGRPELFRAEHKQIYHMLNALTQLLDDLARPGAMNRKAVIDLIDAEKAFKGVLEHHVLREHFHLFPALARLDRGP